MNEWRNERAYDRIDKYWMKSVKWMVANEVF